MSSVSPQFVQALESRVLLNGTASIGRSGGLNILLDDTANTVTVGYSDLAGSAIVVNINGVSKSFAADKVKLVHVHCGAGSDVVTITKGDGTTTKVFDKYTIIRGGAGHDIITTGNEQDVVFGGAGYDTVTTGNGNDSVFGGSGHDAITVGNGNDYIVGGGTHATHGGDTIIAGTGLDTVFGLAGDDVITVGGTGANQVFAGNGDTVNVSGADDTIFEPLSATVTVNGTATVKQITHHNARKTWVLDYNAAIANAKALAQQAKNY